MLESSRRPTKGRCAGFDPSGEIGEARSISEMGRGFVSQSQTGGIQEGTKNRRMRRMELRPDRGLRSPSVIGDLGQLNDQRSVDSVSTGDNGLDPGDEDRPLGVQKDLLSIDVKLAFRDPATGGESAER